VASLEDFVQGKSEPLRNYIERFNKEVVQVQGADENMKQYLITWGQREGIDVKKVVPLDLPETYNQLLAIVKTYFMYEEEVYADNLNKTWKEELVAESSKKPFHNKKKEGKAASEGKGPVSRFAEYTPSVMSREKTFSEISVAELKEAGVKLPKAPSQEKKGSWQNQMMSVPQVSQTLDRWLHPPEGCNEILIQRGRLKWFTWNREPERQPVKLITDGREKNTAIAMSVEQVDEFPKHVEITPYACTWERFSANVIDEGVSTLSMGSMKRKFEELLSVNHLVHHGQKPGGRPPLVFYDHELLRGSPNSAIPHLIQAEMANFDVRRVLIDTGASCDIMYTGLFKTLQMTENNLSPYVGSEFYGFNESSTKPWGYVELLVSFEEGDGKKPIKIPFLVIDGASLYNCIIARTGLARLGAAFSTAHLKLKYHVNGDTITTLHADIEAAQRCFHQVNKNQNTISLSKQSSKDEEKIIVSLLDSNLIELDPRFTKYERKELKKEKKDPTQRGDS